MEEQRPSPEAMLARAAEEAKRAEQGQLKVFFGASPGVGKTYAMLEAAQALRRRGKDVVIGWVETHGRAETEVLVKGLERIAPRAIDHRGVLLHEMDLDALIARRPALALVDELAHENAPTSRHTRRWQDVEELLAAGIDVWTTLNVQHVESLRDVVAGITGITVRQTVPDSVLARADEIELIDLSPDELLRRLEEGKVYIPAQAERALEHFFSKGNLIALRELALRRTAERVDVEGLRWRREHGVRAPWGARARVLVAVGPAPQSADLVRAAYRMAESLKAPWIALSVETPGYARLSDEDRARVAAHLHLATTLGGETLVVRGERLGDEILAAARARDVTHIVVGKPVTHGFFARFRPSVVDWLVRGSGSIEVHVTSGAAPSAAVAASAPARRVGPSGSWGPLGALAAVGLATGVGLALRDYVHLADQAMLYLLAILAVAARARRRDALLAAVLSVLALDYFFVPPFATFAIDETRYLVTFAVLLISGVVVGGYATRVRRQAELAAEREHATATLFDLSRGLSAAQDAPAIGRLAAQQVSRLLGTSVALWARAPGGGAAVLAGEETALARDPREAAVANWVLDLEQAAGRGTDTLPGVRGLHLPLAGVGPVQGVLAIDMEQRGRPLDPGVRQLLDTMASQVGAALERVTRGAEAERERLTAETERTRSTLLAAVSHDLRTPLAGITGSAGALLETGDRLDAAARRELLLSIRDEGERLGRLVSDLLELTRLEAGGVRAKKEWYPVEELVRSALVRARAVLEGRPVEVDLPHEVELVEVDPVLIEQVVWNLLENAGRHTPAGTQVDVRARAEPGCVVVEVLDRGSGPPVGGEERLFERFGRAAPEQRSAGTGLGLALSRAIATAHGGTLVARRREGGGSAFVLSLPRATAPPPQPPRTPDPTPGEPA
jgi:two-component system sensor histidine kinase KdpD